MAALSSKKSIKIEINKCVKVYKRSNLSGQLLYHRLWRKKPVDRCQQLYGGRSICLNIESESETYKILYQNIQKTSTPDISAEAECMGKMKGYYHFST